MYSEQAIPQCAYVVTGCPYVATSRLPCVSHHKGPPALSDSGAAGGLNKARCECLHVFNYMFLIGLPGFPFIKWDLIRFRCEQGLRENTGTRLEGNIKELILVRPRR